MDKFGIFKLLNSFFNFYEQNKSTSPQEKSQTQKEVSEFLNALCSKNTKNLPLKDQTQTKQNNTAKSDQPFSPPLQSAMLATMYSHEQFVKRVKEKNNQ